MFVLKKDINFAARSGDEETETAGVDGGTTPTDRKLRVAAGSPKFIDKSDKKQATAYGRRSDTCEGVPLGLKGRNGAKPGSWDAEELRSATANEAERRDVQYGHGKRNRYQGRYESEKYMVMSHHKSQETGCLSTFF